MGLLYVWMLWSRFSFWINNKTSSANVCWKIPKASSWPYLTMTPYSNRWPICCSKTQVDRFSRARFWLTWCHRAVFFWVYQWEKDRKSISVTCTCNYDVMKLESKRYCAPRSDTEILCAAVFFTCFLPLCESPMFRLHVAVQRTKCGRNPSWRLVRWSSRMIYIPC